MGNVYMEAEQVRFKNSSYHNLQTAVSAALEGGGGGGTTVVANPEGSATADLAKLQVGETIYGIPAEAGDISYDNTSSGMTADDVQEAIDELSTGISSITELIPSGATSSNKLATADDIPDAVTGNPTGTATAGNLTKLQIGPDIYTISGGGARESVSVTASGSESYAVLFRRLHGLIDTSKLSINPIMVITESNTTRILTVTKIDTVTEGTEILLGLLFGKSIVMWSARLSPTLDHNYYLLGQFSAQGAYSETDRSNDTATAGIVVAFYY